MKTTKSIDVYAICGGPFVMKACESLVDLSDEGRFDEEKNCSKSGVLAILVPEPGPMS